MDDICDQPKDHHDVIEPPRCHFSGKTRDECLILFSVECSREELKSVLRGTQPTSQQSDREIFFYSDSSIIEVEKTFPGTFPACWLEKAQSLQKSGS